MPTIAPQDITGLVLAGGRGSRMGGVDKGLQPYHGEPLAWRALHRLAPQVGQVLLNANRHLEVYRRLGVPVCPDLQPDYPGPLAGFLAGLAQCSTPYLVTVPCDSPHFPTDLVARLAQALVAADAEVAIATTRDDGRIQMQPVFCLMKTSVALSLQHFVEEGQHKIAHWAQSQSHVQCLFDDAQAFFNANTLAELQQAQQQQS